MASQVVGLEWKGRKHNITRPRVKRFKLFLAAVEAADVAEREGKIADSVGHMIEAVEMLAPKGLVEECADDELRPLYDALTGALWPGDNGKNPEAEA